MASQVRKIFEALSKAPTTPQKVDQIAALRHWFRPKEDSKIYPQIQSYLSGTVDLDVFISTIAELSTNEGEDFGDLDLSYSIIHSSKRIPYTDEAAHTRLINLVRSLQEYGKANPHPNHGPPLGWHSLAVREAYNDPPRDDYEPASSAEDKEAIASIVDVEANAWANYNYHLARLTHANIYDYATYIAIWAFREALERDFGTAFVKFDAHVPAAAAWVRGLGSELYKKEVDLTPDNNRSGRPAKGGELWYGVEGFGKERWRFWKERFELVGGLEGVAEATRRVAREAVERMERVEGEAG